MQRIGEVDIDAEQQEPVLGPDGKVNMTVLGKRKYTQRKLQPELTQGQITATELEIKAQINVWQGKKTGPYEEGQSRTESEEDSVVRPLFQTSIVKSIDHTIKKTFGHVNCFEPLVIDNNNDAPIQDFYQDIDVKRIKLMRQPRSSPPTRQVVKQLGPCAKPCNDIQ